MAVFDDRVEIWSDGTLPFGLRSEDPKREHPSRPRNPYITDVFYRRGLVEQWGRGTNKIVELCVQAGHPEPEFGQQAGSVFVRFRPVAAQVTAQVTAQVDQVVRACDKPLSRDDLQRKLGLERRENFRKSYSRFCQK